MPAIVASAAPLSGLRRLFSKPAAPAPAPVAPALGSRSPQRLPANPGAMSLNAGDFQPNANVNALFTNPFSPPDVPAERKPAAPRPKIQVVAPEIDDDSSFQSKLGRPRFRSALEQVSYMTSETAFRRSD